MTVQILVRSSGMQYLSCVRHPRYIGLARAAHDRSTEIINHDILAFLTSFVCSERIDGGL
jgi:hypothetical protein